MFDLGLWIEIFQSMNKNRTRSILSGFTVAFAILLFTVLIGIANGLGNTFQEGFADDAINAIFINDANRLLYVESFSPIVTPKQYRNNFGQLLEHSPFCERDFKLPSNLGAPLKTGPV